MSYPHTNGTHEAPVAFTRAELETLLAARQVEFSQRVGAQLTSLPAPNAPGAIPQVVIQTAVAAVLALLDTAYGVRVDPLV